MLNGEEGYNKDLCATLRVPCRFVNDHPCCNYEMPMDLVARSRALDGSADLKWRPISLGGPRTSAQGRSLFRNFRSDLGMSLDSKSADKKVKAVTPEKSKASVTTFTKKLVKTFQLSRNRSGHISLK